MLDAVAFSFNRENFYLVNKFYNIDSYRYFVYRASDRVGFEDNYEIIFVYLCEGYKKKFMLNSAEHEIFPAHKC